MENQQVEHVLDVKCELGEGPVWDSREQALYWVDIVNENYHRLTFGPGEPRHEVFQAGAQVGTLRLRERTGLVLATRRGFAFCDEPGGPLRWGPNPLSGTSEMRFNDGAIDPQGRFWVGTMYDNPAVDSREGDLYRFDPDRTVTLQQAGLAIPNGTGWSPDGRTFYHTDSPRQTIFAYDFNPASGMIQNRRPFIYTGEEPGVPDGLAVDAEGGIWSARWGGWKIARYDAAGRKVADYQMPVECPTSCTFGGAGLDELYITSAWRGQTARQRASQPLAGDIFRLRPGVRGQAEHRFAG